MPINQNYSLFTVPVAWLLAFLPHLYGTAQNKNLDRSSPRTYISGLDKDPTLDSSTKARIIRCEGAQANGFENLGFFATAVLAGNFAELPTQTLNLLSIGYLLSRVVYNFVYIHDTTSKILGLRSLVWLVGVGQIITLYVKSGNALNGAL